MDNQVQMFSSDSRSDAARKLGVSPRELVFKYMNFLPWFIVSLAISLLLAFIKLRYSPNIYSVKGTILVNRQSDMSNPSEKFGEIMLGEPTKDLSDEMQIIKSRGMAKRVINALGLQVQYHNEGKVRSTPIQLSESPFNVEIIKLNDSTEKFSIPVIILNNKEFLISENSGVFQFGNVFETNSGIFRLNKMPLGIELFASNRFYFEYAPAEIRAPELVGSLSVAQSGESNNILELTYESQNPKIGAAIVNQWMREYEKAGLEDRRKTAEYALTFINQQMDTVRLELSGVEKNLLGYRERNKVISAGQQNTQIFNTVSELEKEITKQSVQLEVIDNLISYISDTRNPYRQIASTLGIVEPPLITQINEFNQLQVQRETLLKSTPRSNPILVNTETAIEKLRQGIVQNLRNIREAYLLTVNNLRQRSADVEKQISQIPAKEKQLLDITRRQKILEELFSFLLQKKLETSIGSASTISNMRVLEPALPNKVPVKPNKKGLYTIAFFAGLLIPAGIIFLIEYLNDKVKSRSDVQSLTQAPIIGEVGHADTQDPIVVTRTSRRFIAEQFRIIRTNLQYVLPKKEKIVILVTSTTSGEGKSFISTNMGIVMALAGKKTAILELDIRKPKVMSALGMARKSGITNYIIGKSTIEELPVLVPGHDNLYVVPCGPIPPNPSELLLDDKFDELVTKLKEQFDVLIIDTAPAGLVSDSLHLGKYADAVLYIIRHNYTFKKQLQLLDDIYTSKRLPKVSIIINDINSEGGYGKYYGYGGYGYTGYGYGYGNEYFEESSGKNSWMDRFLNFFNKRR